ncbi:hypothetical protein D9613_005860 [Agrocybe pediades]|uniref:Epoxide hydrolase N-terminal domain-containing protein n=1 Tax=Agrocybe pediades TaxID=84607 RepID=A0A8H4QU75_9AGAR|nr:hypothetical protein D9613_005860 [Agrocybe pediades]
MSEVPFNISVPDSHLEILQQKLALTTLPDELEDAGWEYGVPLADVRRLVARWKEGGGYDWGKEEAKLNAELPQFTRDIDVKGFGALNVHYVHKRSEVVDAIPMLFVHGWPGSFIEVRKVLPLLVEGSPEHPAFHVVALSLPGYGFSEAPKKPGFELGQMAEVVTQGGDWGEFITSRIARDYGKKHCKARHSNTPVAAPPHPVHRPLLLLTHLLAVIPFISAVNPLAYTDRDKQNLERAMWYQKKQIGYFSQQSTQPQTLGYSLADTPVGLLAWIYEKLVLWTDGYQWDDNEVLTWVSIYWFSRAGPGASVRLYYEVFKANPDLLLTLKPIKTVPVGYSYFPKELIPFPRRWLKTPTLVFESEHDSGGHFAAHEKPNELVGDLRRMFGKGGPAFGVVPGKTGF